MDMKNIKLIVEYDGTNYCGWQKQPNAPSIQETLEKAVLKVTGEEVLVVGSGRTDSKVHANNQVANFYTRSKIPSDKFRLALNRILPRDVAVKDSSRVDLDFHACDDAVGKEYKYLIYNNRVRSPMVRNYSYYVYDPLDIDKMAIALESFLGTHDFAGFMATGSSIKGTVRTISGAEIVKKDSSIEITIRGTGFLYNMVRIIAGTLIDVGKGKIDKDDMGKIIARKDRNKAGHTAAARGLYLSKVFY